MMREKDDLAQWLQNAEPTIPDGFTKRLFERLEEAPPQRDKRDTMFLSGILCIAGAFVLFVVLRTPLPEIIPQILQKIGGVFL